MMILQQMAAAWKPDLHKFPRFLWDKLNQMKTYAKLLHLYQAVPTSEPTVDHHECSKSNKSPQLFC